MKNPMTDTEKEIADTERRLADLYEQRAAENKRRQTPPKRAAGSRGKPGRGPVPPWKIKRAWVLAGIEGEKALSIAQVARVLRLGRQTLYDHKITKYEAVRRARELNRRGAEARRGRGDG